MPGSSAPFLWLENSTATQKAAIMVTILPETKDDTGLTAADKKIVIEGAAKLYATMADFNKPGQPGKATDPKAAGAATLTLGASAALILASLY